MREGEGRGSACSNPIVTFIPPPKSGCQMISNKNLEEFSREKNARTTTCERQILMADAPHIVEKKRGRPKKEADSNNICRVCKANLKVAYGTTAAKTWVNLFKPSQRQESLGIVWAERLRKVAGFKIVDSLSSSKVVCKVCYRKISNLCELLEFFSSRLGPEQEAAEKENHSDCEGEKRKFDAILSPARSSPLNRKSLRIRSPIEQRNRPTSRKSLGFDNGTNPGEFSRAVHSNVLSQCNVDDLDTSQGLAAVKVLICYPSGDVSVKSSLDRGSQNLVRNICQGNWKTVAKACFRHELLVAELKEVFTQEIEFECKNYSTSDSRDQLAVFSNNTLCKEVETHCPLLYAALCKASNLSNLVSEENEKGMTAVALAISSLIRCRNRSMSAVAYRMSTILFHSGVSFKDIGRLNHLGVCMSHKSMIAFQERMGDNSDYKAIIWQKTIEANRCAKLLLEEIKRKQVPEREEDDMDLVIDVDVSEGTVQGYEWYNPENYRRSMKQLEETRQLLVESTFTADVLDETLKRLEREKLPFFK